MVLFEADGGCIMFWVIMYVYIRVLRGQWVDDCFGLQAADFYVVWDDILVRLLSKVHQTCR